MYRLSAALIALAVLGCVDLSRPQVMVTSDGPLPTNDLGAERPPDLREISDIDPASNDGPDAADVPDADVDDGGGADLPTEAIPPDAPPAGNGSPCADGPQCASGNCVRGICCDTACVEPCRSCSVAAMPGTCRPVPAGDDPGDHCVQDLESTCKLDGTCDGTGGCRTYAAGTLCAPGTCASNMETAASTCNGSGVCVAGATQSCAPNVCMGASCGRVCTLDTQCQTGFFCEAGKCAVKRAQAAACTGANQCASGFCVDGVCCNSACGDMCFACNVTAFPGICTAAPSGTDPRAQCPMEAASTCGRAGGCNGMGGCQLHPGGTACVGGSCTGSTETATRQCNGAGVCLMATTRNCAPYLCGQSGVCATSCTTAAQCQPGLPCVTSAARCSAIPNLALFWRFEEAAGTTANDDSGNALHGSYTGVTGSPGTSLTTPTVGYPNARSRSFQRLNRHAVTLGTLPTSLRPTLNVTMALWYRATTVDGDGSELISGGNAWNLRVGPTQIEVSKRVAGAFADCRATVANYRDGNWHHVAGVISPTGFVIYFDGTARVACAQNQPISYDMAFDDFAVGRHPGSTNYDFEGNLDEVRVYTRALSAAEIMTLATGGL